jgi:hypothetical protein
MFWFRNHRQSPPSENVSAKSLARLRLEALESRDVPAAAWVINTTNDTLTRT